jgi:tRNA-specific 2-thiouridylase
MANKRYKIAVGMSGGVDSSLAALLLKQEGHRVVGVTMEIFDGAADRGPFPGHACYGPSERDDVRDAREVARFLGIEHHVIDLREAYRENVLGYFTGEYLKGRTPNPCTRCNPVVKFGFLLRQARQRGIPFERFATGHYARVQYDDDEKAFTLRRAVDRGKDQSYFLYGLPRDLLPGLLFPLGALTKAEVRKRARGAGLPVAEREESQDFIEGGDYTRLFDERLIRPGPIVDTGGKRLGTHRGIVHYTIGQRRGLGLSSDEPLYVVGIDAPGNTVTVGPGDRLLADTLTAENINYLCASPPREPTRIAARIRHNHPPGAATLVPRGDNEAVVGFNDPQRAITPGQSVVFYRGDRVLGGGVIAGVRSPTPESG